MEKVRRLTDIVGNETVRSLWDGLCLLYTSQLYIDGKWVDASDGGTLDVYCPANGEQLSTIADATKEDVDRAVDAAWKAFETWSKTSKAERAIILNLSLIHI